MVVVDTVVLVFVEVDEAVEVKVAEVTDSVLDDEPVEEEVDVDMVVDDVTVVVDEVMVSVLLVLDSVELEVAVVIVEVSVVCVGV